MYFGYLLVTGVMLVARLAGWPKASAPFSLGRWGVPLNIVAVLYFATMTINLVWPRVTTNPDKFGLPVAWWLLGAPAVVGLVYFIVRIRPRVRALTTRGGEHKNSWSSTTPGAPTVQPAQSS